MPINDNYKFKILFKEYNKYSVELLSLEMLNDNVFFPKIQNTWVPTIYLSNSIGR